MIYTQKNGDFHFILFNFGTTKTKIQKKYFIKILATWPSGKAGDCRSSFPSSNLGVA
jgi:hypothetical protein